MVAPQVAACMRSEKTGEPAFYQNQTTVCRSGVPSHHISGSSVLWLPLNCFVPRKFIYTQNALPVLWPYLTLWPEWVGSFLHPKFDNIPTDQAKAFIRECNCFCTWWCLLFSHVFSFLSAFATHQSHKQSQVIVTIVRKFSRHVRYFLYKNVIYLTAFPLSDWTLFRPVRNHYSQTPRVLVYLPPQIRE